MGLNLGGVLFELNTQTRDTAFFLHKEDGELEYSLDCQFQANEFMEEMVEPRLCLSPVATNKKNQEELVGSYFEVKKIEEAMEREDTMYLFEHEPLESYQFTILAFQNDMVHIQWNGTAVTDGYARPYQTAEFWLDCWLPIITRKEDWEKFGL